jgi:putative DNA primase/helicase
MTIELRTGIDRPPRREDYCTKSTAVSPTPAGTPCPMWIDFLDRVTDNNIELIGFLRRFLGYCLTGHVHEHVLVFFFGTGANGKSVFTDTVSGIFGDYAITAPMEMFLARKFDAHPTEIAQLMGVRLVVAQETQRGRSWDEAKIKNLTGGDKLPARFMRGDFFYFKPTHKLLFAGNYKPSLRNIDEAIRRRIILVPFTVQIPPEERDPQLAEKLKAEWPAILRWMVDGCLEWRQKGLQIPEIVRKATDQYLNDQDSLGEWIEESLEPKPDAFEFTKALFASWKHFCEERNLPAGTERAFSDSIKDRGFEQHRHKTGRGFKRVALKTNTAPTQTIPSGIATEFTAVMVGPAPAGVPCVQCNAADGTIFRIRDGRVPNGHPEVLHEACARAWFTGNAGW